MPSVFMDPSGGPRWWRRRRWPLIAVAVVLVGAGVALAVYFAFVKRQGNVSHPNVEFTPTTPQKPKLVAETFKWPLYGYTPDRARYLNADIRPPYREIWEYKTGSLIEFQPILVNGVLYVVPNNGEARAIDAKTGKKLWAHHVGSLNASSPAWANNRLFITTLSGTFTCLNAKNGKRSWRRATRPATTSTRRRRSDRGRGAGRPCSSAPTTAPSTRSTRARGRSAGPSTRRAGSRARPPSWVTSCTSRTSTASRPPGSTRA